MNKKQAKTNSLLFYFSEDFILKAELCQERRKPILPRSLQARNHVQKTWFFYFMEKIKRSLKFWNEIKEPER